MVTGMPRGCSRLVGMSIDCFRQQTHQDKELLIINHGEHPIAEGVESVSEIMVTKTSDMNVGQMRNIAFERAMGDWLLTWDDDDWHSPEFIEKQVRHAKAGHAVMLKRTIFCDLSKDVSYVLDVADGSKPTMLYSRSTTNRFPNLRRSSDVFFVSNMDKTVVDNDPSMYIRFHHAKNLTPAELFRDYGSRSLNDTEQKLLSGVVLKYNLCLD